MKLTYILALATVAIFLMSFPFSKAPRRFYLLFVLLFLPFIDLPIAPENYGGFSVFDGLSFASFFFLHQDFLDVGKQSKIYPKIFIALTITLLFGSLNSQFVANSLNNILYFFPVFIYSHLLIRECSMNKNIQKELILAIEFIVIFSIIFLIVQIYLGINFTFYTALNRNVHDPNGLRYPSFFHDPQKYGQYLAMVSFIFLINSRKINTPKLKNYLAFAVVILAMLATGGRSAFIGLFIGLLFLFFFLSVQYRMILLGAIIIASLVLVNLGSSLLILDRLQSFDNDLLFRTQLWADAYNIFVDHPLLGIGIGNFEDYAIAHSSNYFITASNDVVFFDQPESGYLMMLTETGILGGFFYFLLLIIPIFAKIKNHFRSGNGGMVDFFFIASIISWLVSFVSLYSISDKRILVILIVFVCLLIANKRKVVYAI